MYCKNCGNEVHEGEKFCKVCGTETFSEIQQQTEECCENILQDTEFIKVEEISENSSREEEEASSDNEKSSQVRHWNMDFWKFCRELIDEWLADNIAEFLEGIPWVNEKVGCPFCKSSDVYPIQKTEREVYKKGYRWLNGACGTCLMGPFGLLCGLCGAGTEEKSSSETWWICKNCGKEFISQAEALNQAAEFMDDIEINTMFTTIVIAAVIYLFMNSVTFMRLLLLICVGLSVPTVAFSEFYNFLSNALGYSIVDILPAELRKEYLHNYFSSLGMNVAAAIIGIPLILSLLEHICNV